MPKELERRLAARADKLGLTGDRKDAYVYGTLAHIKAMKGYKKHAEDEDKKEGGADEG